MPIKMPNEARFADKNFVMVIYGLPGVGKSTLALSAPRPFWLDVDQGAVRVEREHLKPRDDTQHYKTLLDTLAQVSPKDYDTIIIDTVGALIEVQKGWAAETDPKNALKAGGGFALAGYGIIKSEYIRLAHELKSKFNVILVFHAVKEKDKDQIYYDLVCEGAAKVFSWQPADLGAYMYIDNGKRYLGFTPTDSYSAKSGHGIKGIIPIPELKKGDPNVFLTDLFAQVRANIAAADAAGSDEYARYDEIIAAGAQAVADIKGIPDIAGCVQKIKALGEALTSAAELRGKFNARLKELGITYNKEKKVYEQVLPEAPAPAAPEAPATETPAEVLENPGLAVGATVAGGGLV